MEWSDVQGKWEEYRGRVRSKWGDLTDDDLQVVNGQRDQLIGRLIQRYGMSKNQAAAEVDRWLFELDTGTRH